MAAALQLLLRSWVEGQVYTVKMKELSNCSVNLTVLKAGVDDSQQTVYALAGIPSIFVCTIQIHHTQADLSLHQGSVCSYGKPAFLLGVSNLVLRHRW